MRPRAVAPGCLRGWGCSGSLPLLPLLPLLLLSALVSVGACSRVPLLVLTRSGEPLGLEGTESFSDLVERFLGVEGDHLIYVQYGVSVGDFERKVRSEVAGKMSSLPFDIDASIDANTPILSSLRSTALAHRYSISDPEDILKLRLKPERDASDMLVVNGKATEDAINSGLEYAAGQYRDGRTSVLYVGVTEPFRKGEAAVFKAVRHEAREARPGSTGTQGGVTAREGGEEVVVEEVVEGGAERLGTPLALRDSKGKVKMPVWGHSFMTPQWLQIWILVIISAGLILWGLIVSLKIPTPTNIPEAAEQV